MLTTTHIKLGNESGTDRNPPLPLNEVFTQA